MTLGKGTREALRKERKITPFSERENERGIIFERGKNEQEDS